MLEQFRTFASNKVVRWTFVIFLIIPFGLFGIESFKTPTGGDAIATVGPYRIAQTEFDNALRRQAEQYRAQFGAGFDASMMDNPEIRRGVLDRVVSERLISIGAQDAGVRIGDALLAERIATMAPFQDAAGRFSKARYEDLAKSIGLTPVGLDERIRDDIRTTAFRDSIAETAFVPRTTLDNFIRLSEQSREVKVVNFPAEPMLPKVKVTPEQVKAYFEGHKAEFTTPEQVRAEYLELSAEALAAQVPVAADDVKKFYDANMSRWGQREERKVSHVLISMKADAKEAEKKAAGDKAAAIAADLRKKPANFADVAKKESQDPGSAVQGGDLGFFAKGAMVKPFEDAAFAAKKGEIVGPVLSEFGYHVIMVTDIKPERMKSVAEATPEIEAEIKKADAARRFAESAEAFSNGVYEQSASLKPTADRLKLAVKTSDWLQKAGAMNPALSNPKLLAELFSDDAIKAKRNTSAVEIRPGVLVAARVLEHKPAELRPFETVSAVIERRLQRDEALKLAQADGDAKLKELQGGKDAGVTWPAALAVSRQKPGGLFPAVLDAVFKVDSKKLPVYVGVNSPMGYSLVQVTKVIELETIDDAKREALGTQLRSAVAAQELEASLASVRSRAGVTVRKDALERREEGGSAPAKTSVPPPPRPPSRLGS